MRNGRLAHGRGARSVAEGRSGSSQPEHRASARALGGWVAGWLSAEGAAGGRTEGDGRVFPRAAGVGRRPDALSLALSQLRWARGPDGDAGRGDRRLRWARRLQLATRRRSMRLYALIPRILVGMESAEQVRTPSPAPLNPTRSGPGWTIQPWHSYAFAVPMNCRIGWPIFGWWESASRRESRVGHHGLGPGCPDPRAIDSPRSAA